MRSDLHHISALSLSGFAVDLLACLDSLKLGLELLVGLFLTLERLADLPELVLKPLKFDLNITYLVVFPLQVHS